MGVSSAFSGRADCVSVSYRASLAARHLMRSVMRKKSKLRWANRNHTGWWIFEEVQRWVSNRRKKPCSTNRCLVYLNLRVLKARSREEAYRKAMNFGRAGMPSETHGGEWRFAGISMLLPIYDKIEDGAFSLFSRRHCRRASEPERSAAP